MLDRQVGDAAPGIDPVRPVERLGRADVEAASAGPAMLAMVGRRVRLQLEAGQNDSEEQPAAMLAADEVGMLALPADPGGLGEGLLHPRRGVDEHLELGRRFADAAAANRAFLPRAELAAPRLADLLALDDTSFRKMFAGSPIKRIGVKRMIRNCLIAAGNSGDLALAQSVAPHLSDPDPVVADAAAWAMGELQRP
jgi:hypothetical protein